MKMLMLMMMLLSINFMFMKHPLSMGSILLMQTIFSSLTCSLNLSSYFTSYILFLIFIGGMLILLYMYIHVHCNGFPCTFKYNWHLTISNKDFTHFYFFFFNFFFN